MRHSCYVHLFTCSPFDTVEYPVLLRKMEDPGVRVTLND